MFTASILTNWPADTASRTSRGKAGPISGRRLVRTRMKTKNRAAKIRPGMKPPAKSLPTEMPAWSAIITSMMLGGIRMLNTPPAATAPTLKCLS